MKDERAHLQLFDLIARDWQLASPAQQINFNADTSAVAFACADGSVHLAATADKASPTQRTRRAIDTGRLTIAAREKPFLPLKVAEFTEGRSSDVVAFGAQGFAFAKTSGRINALSAGGIAYHIPPRAQTAIQVLAASPDGKVLAYASAAQLYVAPAETSEPEMIELPNEISAVAFSPDGLTLAVAHGNAVLRLPLQALNRQPVESLLAEPASGLHWHPDGAWLVCSVAADGFYLIDTARNQILHRNKFPAAVRSVGFGPSTATVVASGAFRVAAWALEDGRDVVTGKAGLVLVNAVATCPNRNLVAVGYANGLLSLAEIGQQSEILLREDTGAGITAMVWSQEGKYLALAGTDGSAALVEFPDAMFKS
ncbi:MAG: hypothetical protein U1A24_19180 [Cypionkella sp.]|uniref:WD40 repeat domain-containing protein n=1 Tax=Cypionkella sp. TaxID=2811411 RepID=UPI002AB867CD|nr:hypothetical protein [Cypionkella sp.]MDZ4312675.1 hypothetical protein [Cypionkella sp.]